VTVTGVLLPLWAVHWKAGQVFETYLSGLLCVRSVDGNVYVMYPPEWWASQYLSIFKEFGF